MLRVYLFGPPRLERDGQVLSFNRGKAIALLAYLASTEQPQARDALLALLWPEFDDAAARNNLRRELSLLRTAVGADVLAADRRQISWRGEPDCWVDVAAFSAQIAVSRSHRHPSGLCAACAAALAEAVQLGSAEFLAGFGLPDAPVFDEWLLFQRDELRQQLAAALAALVSWHDERDELQAALSFARRWLALNPLDEAPRRALMQLYARAGQRSAALRQYEEAADLLASELGATPEDVTTALFEAIKAGQRAPAAAASAPPPPIAPPASATPTASPAGAPGAALTSFVGRRREIRALAAQLAEPGCRLLSLIGPGGIGKTRLAEAVAAYVRPAFAQGAAVVPLDSATVPAHVPGAVAAALGVALAGDVEPWGALGALLSAREQLLVLDNMEQLQAAGPQLTALLRVAPRLKLLVTSREALKLHEEWVAPVEGLAVTAEGDGDSAAEAVQLFVERARQARADFAPAEEQAAIERICRLVGGMPLAIELAAAWAGTLSCAEIAEEVAANLQLLETQRRNAPIRQWSVQAVFDQTWARLDRQSQRVLARLSCFAGSFAREAAAEVAEAAPATLSRLLDQALLSRDGARRYRMHPLLRHYAGQRLGEQPEEALASRAALGRYYARFLSEQYQAQVGGAGRESVDAIALERENLPSTLPALLDVCAGEPLRQVVTALFNYFFTRGPYQDGVALLRLVEERLHAADSTPSARHVLAHVLTALGWFAVRQGGIDVATAYFSESATIFHELGLPPARGDATDPAIGLGVVALVKGDYRAASRYANEVRVRSEAPELRSNLGYAWYLYAEAAAAQGLLPAAHASAARALSVAREAGSEWLSAYLYTQLGQIALARGRAGEAEAHFRAAYATRAAFGDREGMALAVLHLGETAVQRDEHHEAARFYKESLGLFRQVGDRGGTARALVGLGIASSALGDAAGAWEHFQEALTISQSISYQHVALDILVRMAALMLTAGQVVEAVPLLMHTLLNPSSRHATAMSAQNLLVRGEELLPADGFAKAAERGRQLPLSALIEQVLAASAPTRM